MKVIDCAKTAAAESVVQKTLQKVQQRLPFLVKTSDQVQQATLERFQRGLGNRFTMVKNFTPEGQSRPIPFILVGPNGITVLNVNLSKGIFRAKEDNWLEMNKTTRQYAMVRVNLIKQTQSMAQAVSDYLAQHGQVVSEVTPVLLFADPGVHIDANRPAIRLVLADGVDRLIASFLQAVEVLNPPAVKGITDLFEAVTLPAVPAPPREDDFFGKDLGLTEKPKAEQAKPAPKVNLPPFLANIHFTRGQWILLVSMLVVSILALMGLILLVVFTAG